MQKYSTVILTQFSTEDKLNSISLTQNNIMSPHRMIIERTMPSCIPPKSQAQHPNSLISATAVMTTCDVIPACQWLIQWWRWWDVENEQPNRSPQSRCENTHPSPLPSKKHSRGVWDINAPISQKTSHERIQPRSACKLFHSIAVILFWYP